MSYPSGRRTSSLHSIVDRNGRYYARGNGQLRWPPRWCGECRMTSLSSACSMAGAQFSVEHGIGDAVIGHTHKVS